MIWLRLIRFPNLLIVAITQFFLYHFILVPHQSVDHSLALDYSHMGLLVLSTMLIAATGYVVNDIVDVPIDIVNKPDTIIVGRLVSIRSSWVYFWVLAAVGFGISLYLGWHINDIKMVGLFPLAVLVLVLYSYYFKRMSLIGNIIVSIFCMFVAGIVLFAERHFLHDVSLLNIDISQAIQLAFGSYMVFAFLSTMYREIVKDIEDVEGDRELGYQTLPISIGQSRSKVVAIFFCLTLLILMALFLVNLANDRFYASALLGLIGFILLCSVFMLTKARLPSQVHLVSTMIKGAMALGIVLIPFL